MNFKKDTIAGWGNYPWLDTKVAHINSSQNAKRMVLEPASIVARGLGRSYGDQAINIAGITALTSSLNKYQEFDAVNGVLKCESGVSLNEIITHFAPLGWFPFICPGTKFITIGGAIANDIHGKAHHVDGSFVNCVVSFETIIANGEILSASRHENSDLFWASFGGLGLLGIIVTATIQLRKIETTFFKTKAIQTKNLDHLLDAIDEADKTYNYSVAWIDSMAQGQSIGRGVLSLGNAATLTDLPTTFSNNPLQIGKKSKIKLPIYFPEFALNNFSVRILNKIIHYTQSNAPEISHYEKFFFPLDAIHDWNKGYGKRGFIQYQFVIPEENGRKNIRTVLQKISTSGCVPFLNVLKKFGPEQGILSFPFKGYTFAIDFPVTQPLHAFTKEMDQLVMSFGGRIYLGKDAMLDRKTFEGMYPQVDEWKIIKQKYDPLHKFQSAIGNRLGLN